ncbi:LysE/ArgO family amino acid transporter [Nibricoccus sp. IMCC34717]|uniref:LysE/ArgO family amino acid transporter n=1 Tax=Nibricoccus sp. IMCC34717 TaxID=3034021 RepID=UPI00385065DC
MDLSLLKGIGVGFAIAAPVGPIGLLILKRSIVESRTSGFVSGLGAATADTIGATIAAFGIQAIVSLVNAHSSGMQIAAGLFLIGFGILTLRGAPPDHEADRPLHERNLWVAYGSTVVLTLANPMTIISLVVVCASVGLGEASRFDAALFVAGVALGSTAWWAILSTAAAWFGSLISRRAFRWINGTAGIALVLFGVYELLEIFCA